MKLKYSKETLTVILKALLVFVIIIILYILVFVKYDDLQTIEIIRDVTYQDDDYISENKVDKKKKVNTNDDTKKEQNTKKDPAELDVLIKN